ncbi:MAG: cysteine desulfurase family protein [Ignavibacteria bacterium]
MKTYRDVYLDYAATTPLLPEVMAAMLPYLKDKFGNPSSIHKFGQETRAAIEIARDDIAKVLNARQSEIYFTSGGTESINFALIGSALTIRAEKGKDEIITSLAEHHATLETCKYLERQGFKVLYLKPNEAGIIDVENLISSISNRTALISLIHINNETGSINPVKEISEVTSERKIIFHIDAVQSFGKIKIELKELKVDLLSASSHKIYGPKGAGFLFIRTETPISPIIFGGSQERNRRGGTENVPGIIGMAKAAQIINSKIEENHNSVSNIKNYFVNRLKQFNEYILFNSPRENSSPYILNISFNPEYFEVDENTLIMNFAIRGVACSSGSACTSGVLEPSHVLLAMGYDEKRSSSAVRFSFSHLTTESEIDYTIEVIMEIIKILKAKAK